jgi:AcrR family transcriptional regulator
MLTFENKNSAILDSKQLRTKLPIIMRAAIHFFVKQGIDRTTIEQIAGRARVAEGALYRHFKGKEELAWFIFSTHLNAFTTELMTRVFAERQVHDRLQIFVQECFAAFESDRDLFGYLILREHDELKKYPEAYLHIGHVAVKVIEQGQADGEIKSGEPYLLGGLLVGALIRACVVRMYNRIPKPLTNYTQEVTESLYEMLKNRRPKWRKH